MYSRWKRLGKLAIEDFLVLLALCCLIGDLVIQQHMWNLGLGDMSKVTPENFKGIMQMIVPGSILYVSSLWAVKFALLFLYKRLAAPGSRLILLYNIALGGLSATFLVIFFDILFQCFPYDKRWSNDPNCKFITDTWRVHADNRMQINVTPELLKSITGSRYFVSPRKLDVITSTDNIRAVNIFSDAIIIALPITMVSRLQMKLKQKLAVAGVFALGFFVIISSSTSTLRQSLPRIR